jgi:PIN domain nuclease of toxin-antitoxin system
LLPRLLLDTHIVVRWLTNPKKLSREQVRVLEDAVRRAEPVALSAMSLLEIAVLGSAGKLGIKVPLDELFEDLEAPLFQILPITREVAAEVALLGSLRDPADRAIVATARVERLRLVTSDQRIIESKLVPVIA